MSKKKQVENMFDNISRRYDLLNHLLSFNIDKLWRNKAIRLLKPYQPEYVLDVATGTADFAISAARIHPKKIVGIDLSAKMLAIGQKKIRKKNLNHIIELQKGDSEALPFQDNFFDAAIVGFGVRNFENLETGLSEIFRVLKPGGVFIVLEFSQPRFGPFRHLYSFYFTSVLPFIGSLVSKNRQAYTYLPESVGEFPGGEIFLSVLQDVGFEKNRWFPVTFGIASIYEVRKPEN